MTYFHWDEVHRGTHLDHLRAVGAHQHSLRYFAANALPVLCMALSSSSTKWVFQCLCCNLQISEINFNGEVVDFNPILIIERAQPFWITKVKTIYPFFVATNALTGRILYSGALKTDLPENYDYGREVEVVETEFIKNIYIGGKNE